MCISRYSKVGQRTVRCIKYDLILSIWNLFNLTSYCIVWNKICMKWKFYVLPFCACECWLKSYYKVDSKQACFDVPSASRSACDAAILYSFTTIDFFQTKTLPSERVISNNNRQPLAEQTPQLHLHIKDVCFWAEVPSENAVWKLANVRFQRKITQIVKSKISLERAILRLQS